MINGCHCLMQRISLRRSEPDSRRQPSRRSKRRKLQRLSDKERTHLLIPIPFLGALGDGGRESLTTHCRSDGQDNSCLSGCFNKPQWLAVSLGEQSGMLCPVE